MVDLILPESAPDGADAIEYQHALLCTLSLPRSRQAGPVYRRDCQSRSLLLQAGQLWDGSGWVPQPLPYGPKARLLLMHICSQAVKARTRYVEIEPTIRQAMKAVGLGDYGDAYRAFRQQCHALAACRFSIGYTAQGKHVTVDACPIEEFAFWEDASGWSSFVILSDPFFVDLVKHAVPLSRNALRGLVGSALALDWYAFLAFRLHALEEPLTLSWARLHAQLGQEYAAVKDFKKESLKALQSVLVVYPSALVEFSPVGLVLRPSPPPVARQAVGVLPGLADRSGAAVEPSPVAAPGGGGRRLHFRTIEKFKALYPRKDVYACEADFRYWLDNSAAQEPKNYDAAFLGFAKRWVLPGS